MTEVHAHATTIALTEPPPEEVPAGADITFKVAVACLEGCDLRGVPVEIIASDGAAVASESPSSQAEVGEIVEIKGKTPQVPGNHTWTLVSPTHENNGIVHGACSLPVHIKTVPHGTSLAVWDIPTPVITGKPFSIKVGAKSASSYELHGCDIDVCDAAGAVVGHGRLGEAPWPGTSALYWAAVDLVAPTEESLCSWSVKFAATGTALPHDGSRAQFSFTVARAPEHTLTLQVVDKETRSPIADAQVRLGAYRATTDETGRAEVQIPKGAYELSVWKASHESEPQPIDVERDFAIEVEMVEIPEVNPDTYWTM